MPELLDLYDENRRLTGKTIIRGTALDEGEHYLVADIWTITPDGHILVDKRHPDKSFGGMWECTGGAVQAGEDSLSGAVRELGEELGIKVDESELRLIHSCRCTNKFVDTYLLVKNLELADLSLQKEEVTEAKLVTFDELEKIAADGRLAISSGRFEEYKDALIISKYI
ncbi:MAG: NUDIX domain-containing protein [Oscillospiraceae bacterium]